MSLVGRGSSGPSAHLGTEKLVDEFRIHPNLIKELGTGQAVLLTKIPYSQATVVIVEPWRPASR